MNLRQCGGPSTLREVMKNNTKMKVALQLQQQYRASVCFWQGVSTNVIRDTKLPVAEYKQAFLKAEVRAGEQLYAQPPEGWNPKILMDGRRVVGGCVRPCWVSGHLRDAGKNICLAS